MTGLCPAEPGGLICCRAVALHSTECFSANHFQHIEVWLWVINEMYSFISTVALPAVQWPVEVEEDLEGLMNVLDDVLSIIAMAESRDSDCTTWQLRVQLASAILDLMMIDTQASVAWTAVGEC